MISIIRIILLMPIAAILRFPAFFINIKNVRNPIIIMFTNFIIPMLISSWILLGGLYDQIAFKIQDRLRIE